MTNTNALTLNGTGIASGGALKNSSSTAATYAGLITLGSNSSIIGGTGTIALTNVGTITGSGFGITLGGAQGGSIASIIGTGSAGALTKQDAGTWTLSGANTYQGGTTISAGELNVTGSLSDSTGVSVSSGATYRASSTDTVGNIEGAGSIVLGTDKTLTVGGSGGDKTFSGIISGAGILGKTGSGTLILSGANTYSGGTKIFVVEYYQ